MKTVQNITRLHYFAKALFLTQGLLLLAAGIKDVILYRCPQNADLQCTRVVSITWLLVGFATVHLISGIFTFFYSCTRTIYEPLICFILWSVCVSSLVFYRVKQLYDFEQFLSTNLATSLAMVTTYAMLMLTELLLHVNLVRLQDRDTSAEKGLFELMITSHRVELQ